MTSNPLDNEGEQPTELTMLKDRARMMGITFSNNISLDKLRVKINDTMEGKSEPVKQEVAADAIHAANPLAGQDKPLKRKTLRQHLHDEEMKMIRIRITCMDPKKKDLPGEFLTVANQYLGTVRKYIPFGQDTENGYHVPNILYKELQARRFLNIRNVKGKNGVDRVEKGWAKEFAIEVLAPLTAVELRQLATAQIAAGSIDHAE